MNTTHPGVTDTATSTPSAEFETRLVAGLRSGDPAAYETLFRTYAGPMLSVARRYFGESEAADVVQDAMLSAFRSMASFEGTARLGTWLHRITVNAALMRLRGRKRRPTVQLDLSMPRAARAEADMLTRDETVSQVRACIDRLPPDYRNVIQLRDLDGLDTGETARRLGLSGANVKTRLHRARQALRTLLEPVVGGVAIES